jgi:uncharacterized protein (TIGR02145 family)
MRNLLFILAIIIILRGNLLAQSGSITNVQVQQRTDGSGLVDVYFDLSGAEDSYFINMRVSFDAGINYYPITFTSMTGDVGPINPGNDKHVVWDPTQDHPNRYSIQTKLMIVSYIIESMNPCPGVPTVTDYDGNVYNTILIGDQCWMKENLNTIRDADGNDIIRYCYNNDPSYCEYYGGLYSWTTLMNGSSSSNGNPSGVQGICPNGWHVPSEAEWDELTNYLINNYVDINSNNVGNKLKSCRQVNSPLGGDCNTSDHPRWNPHTIAYATNDFGFSALGGGYREYESFIFLGYYGCWWSSTEYSSDFAWTRLMEYGSGIVFRFDNLVGNSFKTYGFSVRCVKD